MNNEWIDVSVALRNGMVHWPGDEPFHIERQSSIDRGDICNVSKFAATVHIGTHMDAPVHFINNGVWMDGVPLDAVIGRARVISIKDPEAIRVPEIEAYGIGEGERILFRTANSDRVWETDEFEKEFVYISHEAAEYLAARRVRTVGVDYLSVGAFDGDGPQTHRALLGGGVWIIEGLRLGKVEPGNYDLICLPLRLVGSDGAPARAVLRRVQEENAASM